MIALSRRWLVAILLAGAMTQGAPVWAQTPAPAAAPEKKEEEKKPSLWDEFKLFSYIESSATFNLHGRSRGIPGATSSGDTNLLRFYDIDEGFTFNMAEFSIKRDPNEAFPFGMGLVITAGEDAQKNHSIGILREETDAFPFRNTPWFDLQEAYISGRIPVGNGLVLKAGKWVTLLGYEVIESPSNLNFSRGYLFTLAIPLTHTGVIASYSFTDWLSAQLGVVLGWDDSKNINHGVSFTGQVALTPIKDLTTAVNFIVGPEQADNTRDYRYVIDLTATYTGIKSLTLGANVDYGAEDNDALLVSIGRQDPDARWYGVAGYVAYDWTEKLRTALRQEWFRDEQGARTATAGGLTLLSTTATLQYAIWKGLVGRLEYRHDQGDENVFKCGDSGCRSKSQDTLSVSLFYRFF
jgi:hypothetical protein